MDKCSASEPCGDEQIRYPEPMNNKKPRSINIEALDHGYVIRVGCKNFSIELESKVIDLLSKYLKDPVGTEELWSEGKLL